jgi:hypothetical protein
MAYTILQVFVEWGIPLTKTLTLGFRDDFFIGNSHTFNTGFFHY